MSGETESLLTQIAKDVVDEAVPLTVLLRKCLMLGAEAGSEKLREWATRELNGYVGAKTLPEYRQIAALMELHITNRYGHNGLTQRLQPSVLPKEIFKDVDIEIAMMAQGIGELEAMASNGEQQFRLSPTWASVIVAYLNKAHVDENSVVAAAYWVVPKASIQGMLSRIRTTLVELVAELVAQTPRDQAAPDKVTADEAVRQIVVNGDYSTITLQQSGDGGSITAVTASGADPTAIGSQTAGGDATIGKGLTVRGDKNTVAGRDASAPKEAEKEGWWKGTRKRGILITIATVIAAAVAVFAWMGWTPWG
ncbi:hypothetical protein AB0M80_08955 [Amycolatopsis sp. NPDC051045]|uniref:AbiTii domain-containing protein n=1 Tax=Amycolatopsis sp. NPDC051045 TaxID=3156922 RepID=UPI003417572A